MDKQQEFEETWIQYKERIWTTMEMWIMIKNYIPDNIPDSTIEFRLPELRDTIIPDNWEHLRDLLLNN